MVEASIYFPLAIFVAMAVLLMMLYAYSQTCVQANLHIQVRAEVMRSLGTGSAELDGPKRDCVRRNAESIMSKIKEHKWDGLYMTTYCDMTVPARYFGNRTVTVGKNRTDFYARAYALDEAEIVRLKHLGVAALKGG